jgi:hypothetical protein
MPEKLLKFKALTKRKNIVEGFIAKEEVDKISCGDIIVLINEEGKPFVINGKDILYWSVF